MNKILITGGTGMLGGYVTAALAESKNEVIVTNRNEFDLADPARVYQYILDLKPSIILHFAAETNVDLCEREPGRAGIYNHIATMQIAKAARDCGAWLLYISSSNVFGSESGKYIHNELDLPQPLNYYGRSKLFGEHEVRAFCPTNHLIIRSGWMIGGGPEKDHKFVGKIIQQIKDGATSLKAVNDKLGCITYARQLCKFIIWAVENKPVGTLHYCSSGVVSRFDIAKAIGEMLNFEGSITPVQSSMFPLSAPRPLSEGIESIYLDYYEGCPKPGYWKDDLADYVSTF